MIDSTKIDEKVDAARERDNAVTAKLLQEVARLPVIAPFNEGVRSFDLNTLSTQLKPGRFSDSGLSPNTFTGVPEAGSYANQLFSAICFAIDARAELKLLELCQSPDFFHAIMRSAAEVKEP